MKSEHKYVTILKADVQHLTLELEEDRDKVQALDNIVSYLGYLETRIGNVEKETDVLKEGLGSMGSSMESLASRVVYIEEQVCSALVLANPGNYM